MRDAIAIIVATGAAIVFLLPPGQRPPAARAEAAVAAAPAPARPWATETRLARADSGHFHARALVNGQPVEFIVDSGATMVALTVDDARRIGIPVDPSRFRVIGRGASGPVRGQAVTLDRVSIDGKEVRTLRGAVVEGLAVSLLGQSYLARIGAVEMTGDEMVLR